MENAQDQTMTEMPRNRNASTDRGLPNHEGGFHMKREYTINEELAKTPLRKARYQSMKNVFQDTGGYVLDKDHPRALKAFEGWTREQIEQALDDVILCGDGEVFSGKNGEGIVIKFIDKEQTLKGSASS